MDNLPSQIIEEYINTEHFLLAQLRWAALKVSPVRQWKYIESYKRYKEINKQCQPGDPDGFTSRIFAAFRSRGLDFEKEQKRHDEYVMASTNFLIADKVYKEFLIQSDRFQEDALIAVKKEILEKEKQIIEKNFDEIP